MQIMHRSILAAILAAMAGSAWAASGTISAEPNPCRVEAGKRHCTTYISWRTEGTAHARVLVKAEGRKAAPEREFANSVAERRAVADWIAEGTTYLFTLCDWSAGSRGAVLATVSVSSVK